MGPRGREKKQADIKRGGGKWKETWRYSNAEKSRWRPHGPAPGRRPLSEAAAGRTSGAPIPRPQSPRRNVHAAGCQRRGLRPWRGPHLLREKAANVEVDWGQTPALKPVSPPLPFAVCL